MSRRSSALISMETRSIAQYEAEYREQGWVLVDLPRPEVIETVRGALQAELRQISGYADITLERYHEISDDDTVHRDYQFKLTELFRARRYAYEVLAAQLDFFRPFLGPD